MRCNFAFFPNTPYHAASSFYVAAEVIWCVARVVFCLVSCILWFPYGFCECVAVAHFSQIHPTMPHLRCTWRLKLSGVNPCCFRNSSNTPCHAAPSLYLAAEARSRVARFVFCLVSCILWFPCGFCKCVAISHFSIIHPTMPHLRCTWRLKLSGVNPCCFAILQIHPAILHLRSTWRLRLAPVWLEFCFCLVSCIRWFPCGFCECVAVSHFCKIHSTMPHLRSTWRLKLSGVWLEMFLSLGVCIAWFLCGFCKTLAVSQFFKYTLPCCTFDLPGG